MMVAAVLEVALPWGIGSVGKEGPYAPMLARCFGKLEEAEGLLDVDPVPDVHQVGPTLLSCLTPGPVTTFLQDELGEVAHLCDIPCSVRELPGCRCECLYLQLREDRLDPDAHGAGQQAVVRVDDAERPGVVGVVELPQMRLGKVGLPA